MLVETNIKWCILQFPSIMLYSSKNKKNCIGIIKVKNNLRQKKG